MPSALSKAFAWFAAALFAASLLYFLYAYLIVFGRAAPAGSWVWPTLLNAALFSGFALHHSVLVRPRMRDAVRRAVPAYLERALYTWTASVLFLGVCWEWRPVPGVAYGLDGAWWWLGTAIQVGGIVFTQLGSSAVDPLDLAGVRQVLRAPHGAPAHVPLQTGGVYAIVRHPIYFGWVLLVFGTPVMTATRLVFAIVSTAYLAIAIPLEERALVSLFGDEYRQYRQRVRWRMLPGIY